MYARRMSYAARKYQDVKPKWHIFRSGRKALCGYEISPLDAFMKRPKIKTKSLVCKLCCDIDNRKPTA